MKTWKRVLATTAAVALTTAVTPAYSQQVTIADAAADNTGPGLDIITATVANNDRAIRTSVSFTEVVRGDLIVSIRSRGGNGVRVVSEHRPQRGDRTFLLKGSFVRAARCSGLGAEWDQATDSVRVRLPSRCLDQGNYGAIRVGVLTESARDGGDVDYAPDTKQGSTDWVRRG